MPSVLRTLLRPTSRRFCAYNQEKITDIPLIFSSSVGFEVLQNYPGTSLLHMITSQDTISSYLLKLDNNTQLDGVKDAPSIAVVTIQLLYKLGFNPIILVGQNLAYADNKHYAEGISYASGLRIDPVKTHGSDKNKGCRREGSIPVFLLIACELTGASYQVHGRDRSH